MIKIAIIGGGWYGSHIALELSNKGHHVTLYEKNPRLFSEISGLFGIRLHIGSHYPRSATTQKNCLYGFHEFATHYPELIVPHNTSIYAVGNNDASGYPSKITADNFIKVCQKYSKCKIIYDIKKEGYNNLQVAIKLAEPCIYVGKELHNFFKKQLLHSGVTVCCNYHIESIHRTNSGSFEVKNIQKEIELFDHVVNATSFQALLPHNRLQLPFKIFYQPCLALVYEDTRASSNRPFSFIVMDGWYPCLMPTIKYGSQHNSESKHYILTHGMWTIMASYTDVSKARQHLASIDDEFINNSVRPNCEREINRFLPSFRNRFKYVKWTGAVLAKIKNDREFRNAVTFKDETSGMIYVFPGKVSNIFDAEDEVESLIKNENVIYNKDYCYSYIEKGTLDVALPELQEKITERNTCDLQTFKIQTDPVPHS